jgi:hypothetical protein
MSDECFKFIASVKGKYRERLINFEKQWPPCHSENLVRLELVERAKGEDYSANTQRGRESKGHKHTPLLYSDLFKVERGKNPVRKVLIEGDAGIGKTTLCIAVCEDWANGKLFQQFELVLLLPLRIKAVASAGSLPELLKILHCSPRLCDSVARYLEEEEGGNVLIIADGWDESSESERQEGSFLYEVLFQLFPFMSVIVTSRPSASAQLHQRPCIDRFVKVHGFSKEYVVEYIQSEFTSDQDKADRLLEQLEYNPLVESVCSVPLNCAIVCHLWRTLEEALPTTMTELYTKIILNLILRNIRKMDTYTSLLCVSRFSSLPAHLQQSWWLLCEFAFQALEKDQLVFSQEELEAFFPEGLALDDRVLCFGLLQSTESILEAGYGVSFHFLHLTFQEYLAALHLTRQTPDKQLDVFKSHKPKVSSNRFRMVWKFFFGKNNFLDFIGGIPVTCFIQQLFKYIAGDVSLSGYSDLLTLCHCIFEAHSELINDEVTQFLVSLYSHYIMRCIRIPLDCDIHLGYPGTAHDCTAMLYVISMFQKSVSMAISLGKCVRENQIVRLVDILAGKKRKLQIKYLHLVDSGLTNSSLQALEIAVRGNLLSNLEELHLMGSLPSIAAISAAWLATFTEALMNHCSNLWYVNLSRNHLGVAGATALSRITSDDRHGIILSLNETNLGDNGLTALIESHRVVTGGFHFRDNDIHDTGVSCLANAVCSGRVVMHPVYNSGLTLMLRAFSKHDLGGALISLYILDLTDNPLGIEGTIAITRMLSSSHCKFLGAYLSRCELTTALDSVNHTSCKIVRQRVYRMPQNNYTEVLFLNGNSFTGEGIHILVGFMHLCQGLVRLRTSDCGITSDDLIWLLGELIGLKSSPPHLCSNLKGWDLGNNQVDDRGVSALIDCLPSHFPELGTGDDNMLESLTLSGNPVSMEMKEKVKKAMKLRRAHTGCSVF